ncbi:interferon a3-like isoform X1, partial [Lates japonicus]
MLETLILSSAHIFIFITFIMIGLTVLFLLCAVLAPALCCDWLTHYSRYSNISRTLILHMGDPLTTEESKVSFPYRLYKDIRNTEVESRLVFIRDSLELILNLYHHDNRSSVAWDTDKMDRFLMSVDRQIDGLNTCVMRGTGVIVHWWREGRHNVKASFVINREEAGGISRSREQATGGVSDSWDDQSGVRRGFGLNSRADNVSSVSAYVIGWQAGRRGNSGEAGPEADPQREKAVVGGSGQAAPPVG